MKKHLENYVRLLCLLIFTVSTFVLRLSIVQVSLYERLYMYPCIPLYIEHITASIIILLIGWTGLSRVC